VYCTPRRGAAKADDVPARRRRSRESSEGRPIIVVGASAGGIEALRTLVSTLPATLDASLFVVLHIGATNLSMLPHILSRSGPLPAASAVDGEPIRRSRIYVAPSDHHLLVERDHVRVSHGPKEHRFRPAVDPLFRSAAAAYGRGVIGVILSGTLGDGALGLRAVKNAGGLAVVQAPEDALFQSMPQRALEVAAVDHSVPVGRMAALLVRLCRENGDAPAPLAPEPPWRVSRLSCPDCGGSLAEQLEGAAIHFRCHVGHAFDEQSLLSGQDDTIENALFVAARALAEKAALLRQMAERARASKRPRAAAQLEDQARFYEARRDLILRSLDREPATSAAGRPTKAGR
jgi:two-component system, chemotaxis family, protein-glutamate methylesterase/glutaminase